MTRAWLAAFVGSLCTATLLGGSPTLATQVKRPVISDHPRDGASMGLKPVHGEWSHVDDSVENEAVMAPVHMLAVEKLAATERANETANKTAKEQAAKETKLGGGQTSTATDSEGSLVSRWWEAFVSGMTEMKSRPVLCCVLGILLFFIVLSVILRCCPAPHVGVELYHDAIIGVDPNFSLCAVAGRWLRCHLLFYFTYIAYPGRIYTCFTVDPTFKKMPLLMFITGPVSIPLINWCVALKNLISPGSPCDMPGFQADSPEACAAERSERGLLARWLHVSFFNLAMTNHKVWTGSASPASSSVLSKDHWRALLVSSGAYVPPLLARYKGKSAEWLVDSLPDADVVVKPEAGCLGEASDCFKKDEWKTKDDIQKKMNAFLESEKKNAAFSKAGAEGEYLLLERVQPDDRGVHLLEVCTAVDKSGRVGVVQMTYFLDTNSFTSHQASSRYRCDASKCTIKGGEQWFRRRAMNDDPRHAVRFGQEVPNAKEAIDIAITAHEREIKVHPGRKFLGWDCMFTKEHGACFFEGNTMELRLGRSTYNSWAGLWLFMLTFEPPSF